MKKLKCLDEYRLEYDNKELCFEETSLFGYIYEVDDTLGNILLETGKFEEVKPPKPGEKPSADWLAPTSLPNVHRVITPLEEAPAVITSRSRRRGEPAPAEEVPA